MCDKFYKAMYYLRIIFQYFLVVLLLFCFFGLVASFAGWIFQAFINPYLTDFQAFLLGCKFALASLVVFIVLRILNSFADKGEELVENENKEKY